MDEPVPGEYPKMLYHLGDVTKQKTVNSPDEELAAGDDWLDDIIPPEDRPA